MSRLALPSLWRGVRNLASHLVMYLPMVLMATLALLTYWLYRQTPGAAPAVPERAERHEADYFMRGFAIRDFDGQGRLRSEVRGELLRHYPDTDTLEIENIQMRSPKEQHVTVARAKRAISNADASEVQLIGLARIERSPQAGAKGAADQRLGFEGEFLHVFARTERVRSHKPVLVTRGSDRIEASSLDFSYLDRNASFSGRVSARFDSKPSAVSPPVQER